MVNVNQRFGESCCLFLQVGIILKVKRAATSEIMASLCRTTQHQQPVERSLGTVLFVYFNVSVQVCVSIDNALVLTSNVPFQLPSSPCGLHRARSRVFVVNVQWRPWSFEHVLVRSCLFTGRILWKRKGTAAVVITFGLIVRVRSNEEETNQVR